MLAGVFRANRSGLMGGTCLGLLAAAGPPAYSRFVEGRIESVSQVSTHVAVDAASGLGVAIVVLGIILIFRQTAVSR